MNAEIIFRLEHALAGPSTADQLATIARDLQTFLKTLQAQQRAMLEQDKRAATPRKEMPGPAGGTAKNKLCDERYSKRLCASHKSPDRGKGLRE